MRIVETKTKLERNPNTKTTYIELSKEVRDVTKEEHGLTTSNDTCKWFRRFGGSETKTMAYTCSGYVCVKLISKSPDRQIKIVREYKFIQEN